MSMSPKAYHLDPGGIGHGQIQALAYAASPYFTRRYATNGAFSDVG